MSKDVKETLEIMEDVLKNKIERITLRQIWSKMKKNHHMSKEYNFKEYETNTVEKAVTEYGKGNIYTAVFNMEAKIASLQVEANSLREMIDWDTIIEEGEE
tara:strand:+ start:214 stop:516 length:303 start_codon:yes stop_codon:yes gene_type:complete